MNALNFVLPEIHVINIFCVVWYRQCANLF